MFCVLHVRACARVCCHGTVLRVRCVRACAFIIILCMGVRFRVWVVFFRVSVLGGLFVCVRFVRLRGLSVCVRLCAFRRPFWRFVCFAAVCSFCRPFARFVRVRPSLCDVRACRRSPKR